MITDLTGTVTVALWKNETLVSGSTVTFDSGDLSPTTLRAHLGLVKFNASSDRLQMYLEKGSQYLLLPIDPNAQSGNLLTFLVTRSLNNDDGQIPGVVGKVVAI